MKERLVKAVAGIIVLVGVFLFLQILYKAGTGSLTDQYLDPLPAGWAPGYGLLLALSFGLPIPFHVVSIGLFIQRAWLTPRWAKTAWFGIVISGCWLGISLFVRMIVIA